MTEQDRTWKRVSESERLLASLIARGVAFMALDGDRLRYDAPPGALDAALVEAIRAHKAELLALLERAKP